MGSGAPEAAAPPGPAPAHPGGDKEYGFRSSDLLVQHAGKPVVKRQSATLSPGPAGIPRDPGRDPLDRARQRSLDASAWKKRNSQI